MGTEPLPGGYSRPCSLPFETMVQNEAQTKKTPLIEETRRGHDSIGVLLEKRSKNRKL